jgi:hypothetical protein
MRTGLISARVERGNSESGYVFHNTAEVGKAKAILVTAVEAYRVVRC